MNKIFKTFCGLTLLGFAGTASAVVIDFTGGTATKTDGTTAVTTAGQEVISPTDFYVENGFKLDFINSNGGGEYIGDYYGQDASGEWNDVIHGHWAPGHGDLTAIEITAVDNSIFDLNYFILTSNTQIGGGSATGLERTYIEAWSGGVMTHSQLLAPDSWGWDGVQNPGPLQNDPSVFLGSEFDAVDMVRFTVEAGSDVYCFGMDEFYINEEAPVPAPGVLALLAGGLGLIGIRRRLQK